MKYIRWPVWVILALMIALIAFMINTAIHLGEPFYSDKPVTDTTITNHYPKLYDAIFRRNAQKLIPFLKGDSSAVRAQAWRALANTPVEDLQPFINLAERQHSVVAWLGISQHAISTSQLRELQRQSNANPGEEAGIARVLGLHGDQQTLNFLVSNIEDTTFQNRATALATGRLILKGKLSEQQQIKVIRQAFQTEKPALIRAYLYGWYRNGGENLTPAAKDTLYNRWEVYGNSLSPEVDQYVNRILKARTTRAMATFYGGKEMLEKNTLLAIELAKSLKDIPISRKNALAAKILLSDRNANVRMQVLKSLRGNITRQSYLYDYIRKELLRYKKLSDDVWIQALAAAITVDSSFSQKYAKRLSKTPDRSSYLWPQVLAIYGKTEQPSVHIDRINKMVQQNDTAETFYAIRHLSKYWQKLPSGQKSVRMRKKVRRITFDALKMKDRSITDIASSLLADKKLFGKQDFNRINHALRGFLLPGDVEVFQDFGVLYKKRFQQQGRPVIDSLAALHYPPLNRSLHKTGWKVDTTHTANQYFRKPNWKRLWQLGRHPVWILQTHKGRIEIRMNTLQAPATISAIDSLSRAGAYKNIPFHRVVANFVVQGGDIQGEFGFGGPNFVLPTEASEKAFGRGAVGIASAGTDTEGSQYYFMLDWSPHLNGHYTRFGKVISGMDVVDRLTVGDKVIDTGWR